MEPNVLSVARRQAIIYQMCQSLATAPLGTTRDFPTYDTPVGPSLSPSGLGLDSQSLVFLPVLGEKEAFVYL